MAVKKSLIPKVINLVAETVQAVEVNLNGAPSSMKQKEAADAINAGIEVFDEFKDIGNSEEKENLKSNVLPFIQFFVNLFHSTGIFDKKK